MTLTTTDIKIIADRTCNDGITLPYNTITTAYVIWNLRHLKISSHVLLIKHSMYHIITHPKNYTTTSSFLCQNWLVKHYEIWFLPSGRMLYAFNMTTFIESLALKLLDQNIVDFFRITSRFSCDIRLEPSNVVSSNIMKYTYCIILKRGVPCSCS